MWTPPPAGLISTQRKPIPVRRGLPVDAAGPCVTALAVPGLEGLDQLRFAEADLRFHECVVQCVADGTDRGVDAGLEEVRCERERRVLGGFNRSSQHLNCGGVMGRPARWMKELTGRSPMKSPGAPSLRREVGREFWREIASGLLSEEAAAAVGVSPAADARWFRQRGDSELTPSSRATSVTVRPDDRTSSIASRLYSSEYRFVYLLPT